MWDYVYYYYYLDSIHTNNHTALQKYVYDLVIKRDALCSSVFQFSLTIQVQGKEPEFFPRKQARCLKEEEDSNGQKLELMQAEIAQLLQRFKTKEASKSAIAKKEEGKSWEEEVLIPQRRVSHDDH